MGRSFLWLSGLAFPSERTPEQGQVNKDIFLADNPVLHRVTAKLSTLLFFVLAARPNTVITPPEYPLKLADCALPTPLTGGVGRRIKVFWARWEIIVVVVVKIAGVKAVIVFVS